jgi:putative hydrolase of the HAD superfamily
MLRASAFEAFYATQTERLLAYPPVLMQDDLPDVLAKLACRYELALMSNTGFVNGAEMRRALEAIGILKYFTYQIFSDEVGVNKPNPKIFQYLLSISGAEASQVVHVGDNRSADYDGAHAVGIHGVHLPSTLTVRDAVSFLL